MIIEIQNKKTIEIYGSFFLNENEFAIPVKDIQEVVSPPEKLIPMPLSPSYVLGIFNLRGMIIPVIDLKFVLRLGRDSQSLDGKKISIVEINGTRLGLLFDSTGEIFRNWENDKSDFNYEGKGNVVSGAIKLDLGQRIIQTLDIQAIFRLENIPMVDDRNILIRTKKKIIKSHGSRSQCISFLVGPNRLGLDIEAISEIINPPKLKNSVLDKAGACIGIFELRGDIIPVVDFAALLKYREVQKKDSISEDQRVLIIRVGTEKVGLLIDSVENIVTYYKDDLLYIPPLSKEKSEMFCGCLSDKNIGDIVLLKQENILSHVELSEITHGHSQLYKTDQQDNKKTTSLVVKKTYISFKIDNFFALEMEEVKEIIEYPDEIIRPPALSPFIKGMLNLRGKIVTILDAKALYGIKGTDYSDSAKILIFEKYGISFGLIVDSVENIISIPDNEKVKLPAVFYKNQETLTISDDVKFAIEAEIHSEKKILMILNLDFMIKRTGCSIVT